MASGQSIEGLAGIMVLVCQFSMDASCSSHFLSLCQTIKYTIFLQQPLPTMRPLNSSLGTVNQFLQSKPLKIPDRFNYLAFPTKQKHPPNQTLSNRSHQDNHTNRQSKNIARRKLLHKQSQTIHSQGSASYSPKRNQPTANRLRQQAKAEEMETMIGNKFKRFSKILKQKYLFFSNSLSLSDAIKQYNPDKAIPNEKNNIKINHDLIKQFTKKENKTKNIFVGIDRFNSNLKFKKRPSSGVPLKHKIQGSKEKQRLASFSICPNQSLELKHIEALCFNTDPQSTKSANSRPQNSRCHCVRGKVKTEALELRVKGIGQPLEECICIDPWQYDMQRLKHLCDLDISIKMPY